MLVSVWECHLLRMLRFNWMCGCCHGVLRAACCVQCAFVAHCIRLPTLIRCVGRTQTGDSQQQQMNGNPSTKSQMNACALACNHLIWPFYWTRIHVVLLLTFCPLRKFSQGKWQCWYWNTIDCIGVCRAHVYVSVLCGCCGVWTLYRYFVVQHKCFCRWEFILSILTALYSNQMQNWKMHCQCAVGTWTAISCSSYPSNSSNRKNIGEHGNNIQQYPNRFRWFSYRMPNATFNRFSTKRSSGCWTKSIRMQIFWWPFEWIMKIAHDSHVSP